MPAVATKILRANVGSAPALVIETVSDYQSFLTLGPVWTSVLRASQLDHPFVEHDWIRTWWECFGQDSELRVLLVKESDDVIAIVPLILSRVRMYGVPVRRLGFFYNAHVPGCEFIISSRSDDVYRSVWHYLAASHEWDVLQLCQLPVGCETLAKVTRLAADAGCPTGTWKSGAAPYINLDQSWESYCNSLAAKHRANLRNRLKRLKLLGGATLDAVNSKERLTEALTVGFQIEAAAWKGRAGTAILCDPAVERFYRVFAERAAERGWLRLHFLTAGSETAAFDYSLRYNNQLFLLKMGYDPTYSAYSPSNLLLAMVLEDAFRKGLTRYDFLGESGDWKGSWSKAAVINYWLFVFRPTLKGRILFFLKFHTIPLLKRFGLGNR